MVGRPAANGRKGRIVANHGSEPCLTPGIQQRRREVQRSAIRPMKLPILALLPDGQVRVYDEIERILGELRAEDIAEDKHRFYDCEGCRLRYTVEFERQERRFLGLFPLVEDIPRLTLIDYNPPLDRRAEIDRALRDYVSWPGFRYPPKWIETATLDELISQARLLLW